MIDQADKANTEGLNSLEAREETTIPKGTPDLRTKLSPEAKKTPKELTEQERQDQINQLNQLMAERHPSVVWNPSGRNLPVTASFYYLDRSLISDGKIIGEVYQAIGKGKESGVVLGYSIKLNGKKSGSGEEFVWGPHPRSGKPELSYEKYDRDKNYQRVSKLEKNTKKVAEKIKKTIPSIEQSFKR